MKTQINFGNLIRDLKKSKLWISSAPALFQNCYPWVIGFIDMKKYLGFGFRIVPNALKSNYVWQFIDEDENYLITKRIFEMYAKKTLFDKFKIWQSFREKLTENFRYLDKTNLKKLSNKELVKTYLEFMKNLTNEWTIPLVMEGTAIYTEKKLFPEFKKELSGFNNKLVNEYFAVLTQPEKLSFIGNERLSFLNLCFLILKNKKLFLALKKRRTVILEIKSNYPDFYYKLLRHQENFYWVRNNYLRAEPINISGFFLFLKEELKNKSRSEINKEYRNWRDYAENTSKRKKRILKKIRIPKKLKKEIEAISFFTSCFDIRKEVALRSSYYLIKILKELAKRIKINYFLLDKALPGEMAKIIQEGKKKWRGILTQRKKKAVSVYQLNFKPEIYSGKKADDLWEVLFEEEGTGVKSVDGITVSQGGKDYVKGKVRIVFNPFKDDFKAGEILVATMTRPDFLPLVKKAKAIVTDEGGMTCHAAIISRELNIPCIVGTKKATKVFQNGDRITLRLNHGKVEKI